MAVGESMIYRLLPGRSGTTQKVHTGKQLHQVRICFAGSWLDSFNAFLKAKVFNQRLSQMKVEPTLVFEANTIACRSNTC